VTRRWLAPLLVLLAAPVGATLAARHDTGGAVAPTDHARGLRGEALPPGLAGSRAPAITLADARGGRSGTAAMAGRPYLVTFLYTHCPDECPATAAAIGVALHDLGRRAGDVGVLAVSVDPRGDTPGAARAFLRRHGLPHTVHYLVGSARDLRPVWRDWMVAGGGRHSLATWVVDARGRRRAIYASDVPAASDLTHDLAALLAG
jgi:protein SCO1/2